MDVKWIRASNPPLRSLGVALGLFIRHLGENYMRLFVLFILFFCTILTASAELLVTAPSKVCNFLNEAGLASGSWKIFYDQEFFCTTSLKELGSGSMGNNPNNLMFSATGNKSTAMQVDLFLNINDQASSSSAHQELLKATEVLSIKATGKQLPQKLKNAIKKGSNASQKVGNATVEILREDWTTGEGYDVKVTIK